jgi:hypothetical protein
LQNHLSVHNSVNFPNLDCSLSMRARRQAYSNPNRLKKCLRSYDYDYDYCIGSVMVKVFASSAVNYGFEPWSGDTKNYQMCICCFSTYHTTLRSKSRDWLPRNQNNMSDWDDMFTCRQLYQWASAINIQQSLLV